MTKKLLMTMFLIAATSLAGCNREADAIGKACEDSGDCPGDLFCSGSSPTDVCAADCDDDDDCHDDYGSQFDCVNGNTRCARRCDSDKDCPDTDCVPFTSGDSYCSD